MESIPNFLKRRALTSLNLFMNRTLPEKVASKLESWNIPDLRLPEVEDSD
jgi:hypothetical protein